MADFSYEIKMELGVMSENKKGWTKELNLVSWSGRSPKYDIRDWAPEHTQMGKGITLTEEELRELGELINQELHRLDSEGTVITATASNSSKNEKAQESSATKSSIKETQKTSAVKKSEPKIAEPDISGAVNFDDM